MWIGVGGGWVVILMAGGVLKGQSEHVPRGKGSAWSATSFGTHTPTASLAIRVAAQLGGRHAT